jgi:hypothetical protein
MYTLEKINKKITIKNWKINFFSGFFIINKSDKIPKKKINKKKNFSNKLLFKKNILKRIKKPPLIGTNSFDIKDLCINSFLSTK